MVGRQLKQGVQRRLGDEVTRRIQEAVGREWRRSARNEVSRTWDTRCQLDVLWRKAMVVHGGGSSCWAGVDGAEGRVVRGTSGLALKKRLVRCECPEQCLKSECKQE